MDLTEPWRSVTSSLDGPVLAVLATTTGPQTLTDVHRRSVRGSLAGVAKVLERLRQQGLVHEVPGGYVLNRDHVAAPVATWLEGLRRAVLDRIREAVSSWDQPVLMAGVYGSFARGDGDEASDVDVLVIVDDDDEEDLLDPALDLAGLIWRWTGNEGQVVLRSRSWLEQMVQRREPIVDRWRDDLVVLVGSPADAGWAR